MAIHLHCDAPAAERVLLPGDPGRARRLADSLLEQPRTFNENRGLLGYTGTAHDGAPLTIQSTGMGGPSTAIVAHELVALGARRLLRVGTCGALGGTLALGDLVLATEACALDGTSRALGAGERIPGSASLTEALRAADAGLVAGLVVSTDLFYDERGLEAGWAAAGAIAVEMETATLFAVAARLSVQAGSLLAVTDLLRPAHVRIGTGELAAAEWRLGAVAVRALRDGPAASR